LILRVAGALALACFASVAIAAPPYSHPQVFVDAAQKRDIFYSNAARFLRLGPEIHLPAAYIFVSR
jgi:predicted TIM-barrel fold metal-dependent hydrolase